MFRFTVTILVKLRDYRILNNYVLLSYVIFYAVYCKLVCHYLASVVKYCLDKRLNSV